MPKVKCRDCGWLGVLHPSTNAPLFADVRVRENGQQFASPDGRAFPAHCFCEMNKRNFPRPNKCETVAEYLDQEIDCDCLTAIQQGKTPEKIREMSIVEQVRAETRAFQEATERALENRHQETLKWQKQVEKNVEARFLKAETNTESRHGRSIGFSFLNVLLVAAIGGGGGALVTALVTWLLRVLSK